jgi:hypothetical protein
MVHDCNPHSQERKTISRGADFRYTMLAKTGTHARAGIAKAALTPSDLVAGRLRLGPKQSEEIRRSLRQSRIPATERASAAR